jgi:START domain
MSGANSPQNNTTPESPMAAPGTTLPRFSRSVSYDPFHVHPDGKRGDNTSGSKKTNKKVKVKVTSAQLKQANMRDVPKKVVKRVLRERSLAELVTDDFLRLSDAFSVAQGVRLTEKRSGASLVVYALIQLPLGKPYLTQNGLGLTRTAFEEVTLAEKTKVPFNPYEIGSASLVPVVFSAIATKRDLNEFQKLQLCISSLSRFYAHNLREQREEETSVYLDAATAESPTGDGMDAATAAAAAAAADDGPTNILLQSLISNIADTIASVRLKVNYVEDAQQDWQELKAPAETTLSVSLLFHALPKTKAFHIAKVNGSIKMLMQMAVPALKTAFPYYAGFDGRVITVDEATKALAYELTVFLSGDIPVSKSAAIMVRDFDLEVQLGVSAASESSVQSDFKQASSSVEAGMQDDQQDDEQDEQEEESDRFLPPGDRAAASVSLSAQLDSTLISTIKRIFAETDYAALVNRWLDVPLLVKALELSLVFKDAHHLLSRTAVGRELGDNYVQIREVADAILAMVADRFRENIAIAVKGMEEAEQKRLQPVYDKLLKNCRKVFSGFNGIVARHEHIHMALTGQGFPLFDILPLFSEMESIEERRQLRKKLEAEQAALSDSADVDYHNFFSDEDFDEALTLLSQPVVESDGWVPTTKSHFINSWIRKDPDGKNPDAVRIAGHLENISVAQAAAMYLDVPVRNSWDTYLTEHSVLETIIPNKLEVLATTYWVPPSMDKREFIELRETRQLPNGFICLSQSVRHRDGILRPGYVHGHTHKLVFVFRELYDMDGKPYLDARGYVLMSYGGHIPDVVLNFMNRTVYKGWMNLYAQVCSKRYGVRVKGKKKAARRPEDVVCV